MGQPATHRRSAGGDDPLQRPRIYYVEFEICREVLGEDATLAARAATIRALRDRGEPTVPSTVAEEKATNPFLVYPLREKDFAAQAAKFGELRKAKDRF
ncbi:hydroxyacylglutathione hydrolase C-terminal domain-containing protein [Asticcacaulis sp. MM231]|uniref:hydroxyacylglutathione hydrolase C-terminal domain-containing protein n=1 Tax=Asticcacaulis sp. MM231 TaxID=3157666 RepID=UPI0032D5A7BE